MTWEELKSMKSGTILKDWYNKGIRCLIIKGPSSLCAYVGIPNNHPLAGFHYDDISLDCHGGLTFSGKGDGEFRPQGFYWYGWDYGHCDDAAFYDADLRGKKWLVEDVEKDIYWAIADFIKLVSLAEKIKKETHGLENLMKVKIPNTLTSVAKPSVKKLPSEALIEFSKVMEDGGRCYRLDKLINVKSGKDLLAEYIYGYPNFYKFDDFLIIHNRIKVPSPTIDNPNNVEYEVMTTRIKIGQTIDSSLFKPIYDSIKEAGNRLHDILHWEGKFTIKV